MFSKEAAAIAETKNTRRNCVNNNYSMFDLSPLIDDEFS